MRTYVLKRLLLMIPTTIGITMIAFAIALAAPGGPFEMGGFEEHGAQAGQLNVESQRILKEFFHLDKPAPVAYVYWLRDFFNPERNISIKYREPNLSVIWRAAKVTLLLNVISIFIVYVVSIPVGVDSALNSGRRRERYTTIALFLLYAMPSFWVASLLQLYLGSTKYLGILPVEGIRPEGAASMPVLTLIWNTIPYLVLPVVTLSYASFAGLSRYMRVGMMDVIRQDYVRTARAKGLSENAVVYKHALRNALIPLITLAAGLLPSLLSGSVIIEVIFNIPGLGRLGWDAVMGRDYPLLNTLVLVSAVLVQLGILMADIGYAIADPRISFGGEGSSE